MIVQTKEIKTQQSLIDLLGGSTKKAASSNSKSNDLFAKLLNSFGMQTKTDDTKTLKSNDFKAIIDPKNTSAKTVETKNSDTKVSQLKELQSLLGATEEKETLLISKEAFGNLSENQVKTLIQKAKDYLKNEITAKNPEYQNDAKSLPKTLGGLVQLADKLGLEPQKITLATLITEPEEKVALAPEILSKPLFDAKAIAVLPAKSTEDTATMETITQLLSEFKNKEQKASTSSVSETTGSEKAEKNEKEPLKALLQTIEQPLKHSPENSSTVTDKTESNITPLTTAATTPKSDLLISLLQGSNETKETKSETASLSKIDGETQRTAHIPKAESLEVKSKEAAQSMRYFASDLKEAVQEYKPPFTRLTMKLNPEKLGEVEVTLVQRGNNVHVNIQSNNTNSVAFLAHNATELKAQLASQGITNATMNFMSGGDGQNNQQQGQQQQQGQHNRFRAYESFEELQLNEEQLSALEIIIPHYA